MKKKEMYNMIIQNTCASRDDHHYPVNASITSQFLCVCVMTTLKIYSANFKYTAQYH